MNNLDEAAFMSAVTHFLAKLRGPNRGAIEPDQNLITEAGLDSVQLIALLRHIEELRGGELLEVPEIGELTLRTAYGLLYLGDSSVN